MVGEWRSVSISCKLLGCCSTVAVCLPGLNGSGKKCLTRTTGAGVNWTLMNTKARKVPMMQAVTKEAQKGTGTDTCRSQRLKQPNTTIEAQ